MTPIRAQQKAKLDAMSPEEKTRLYAEVEAMDRELEGR